MARDRRNDTDEFKQKMVELYNSGKQRTELIREYKLTPSALSSWIKKYNNTGSFHAEDNRSDEKKRTNQILHEKSACFTQIVEMNSKIRSLKKHSKHLISEDH